MHQQILVHTPGGGGADCHVNQFFSGPYNDEKSTHNLPQMTNFGLILQCFWQVFGSSAISPVPNIHTCQLPKVIAC